MAADAIHRVEGMGITAPTGAENGERRRSQQERRNPREGQYTETAASKEGGSAPNGPSLDQSQIIDSDTLVELLSRSQPTPSPARLGQRLLRLSPRPRRKVDAPKVDKSA